MMKIQKDRKYKHLIQNNKLIVLIIVVSLVLVGCGKQDQGTTLTKPVTLINVSYDPTRDLYQEYNTAFSKYWQKKNGQVVVVRQSHGGTGKQARSVMDGLEADIVTLALAYDIDAINKYQEILNKEWQTLLPNNATPFTSTIVFLVRKGNPQNINDWDDLVKPGLTVITSNPKISGGARWNYLAAWGYALQMNDNDADKAREFVRALYGNVPILDSGARDSLTTFVERGLGDVLISWENEALLATRQLNKSKDDFEIVVPSMSILAEPPVAVIDSVIDKKGTRQVAEAYLEYLYSEEGQEIAAKNFYRPRNESIAKKYASQFTEIDLFTIDEVFGGWSKAQKEHFNDGGVFDQILTEYKRK